MCHGCAKDTGYRGTIFMYLPFRRLKVAVWFSDDSCYIWTIARMFQKWQLTINLFHLLDIVTNTSLGIFYVSCYVFISSVYSVNFYISKFKNSSLYFFTKSQTSSDCTRCSKIRICFCSVTHKILQLFCADFYTSGTIKKISRIRSGFDTRGIFRKLLAWRLMPHRRDHNAFLGSAWITPRILTWYYRLLHKFLKHYNCSVLAFG